MFTHVDGAMPLRTIISAKFHPVPSVIFSAARPGATLSFTTNMSACTVSREYYALRCYVLHPENDAPNQGVRGGTRGYEGALLPEPENCSPNPRVTRTLLGQQQ